MRARILRQAWERLAARWDRSGDLAGVYQFTASSSKSAADTGTLYVESQGYELYRIRLNSRGGLMLAVENVR